MEPLSAEKKRREPERRVPEKVGDYRAAVNVASQVDQVVVALYSLAASLFPLDANSFSGSLDEKFRDELLAVEFPSEDERIVWWNIFYKGSAFRAFARFLLYDVASNWLAYFPTSARKHSYDVFLLTAVLLRWFMRWFLVYSRLEMVVMIQTSCAQMPRDCFLFACWKIMGCLRWLEISVVVVNLKILAELNSSRLFLWSHSVSHIFLIKQDKVLQLHFHLICSLKESRPRWNGGVV